MSENLFSLKNFLSRPQQMIKDYINCDLNEEIDININRIEKVATKYFVFISPSFEDYVNGNRPKKRLFIKCLIVFINVLTAFRFGICAIFNNKWIVSVMSDANWVNKDCFQA